MERSTRPGSVTSGAVRLLTAEELAALSDRARSCELVRGQVREVSPTGWAHGEAAGELLTRLRAHARAHDLGAVLPEVGFVLSRDPDTVRGPDVAFVARHRIPDPLPGRGFVELAPDLVVEVVSPGDAYSDVSEQVEDYLAAGVREVGVVDPRRRRRLRPPPLPRIVGGRRGTPLTREEDEPLRFVVAPEEAGEPVLSLLGERLVDATTSGLRDLIEDGDVLLNGHRCGPRQAVVAGDALEVWAEGLERIAPARLAGLTLLHAERDLIVVDKPAGVAVECERGQDDRPLRAGLLHLLRGLDRAQDRPRPAHRLDKETSGALMVATTRAGLVALTAQLEAHTIEKTYLALVLGVPREERGEVDRPLHGARGEEPRHALTRWEVVERFKRHALVRAWPVTGRQHQVRLHMQALGHALVVDPQHGGGEGLFLSRLKRGYRPRRDQPEKPLIGRLTLHAQAVAFDSPADGRRVKVEAPLPDDFEVALRQLRKWDA